MYCVIFKKLFISIKLIKFYIKNFTPKNKRISIFTLIHSYYIFKSVILMCTLCRFKFPRSHIQKFTKINNIKIQDLCHVSCYFFDIVQFISKIIIDLLALP